MCYAGQDFLTELVPKWLEPKWLRMFVVVVVVVVV